jgi:MFS family permease
MSYPQQPGGWSDPSWPPANQPHSDPGYGGYSGPPADPGYGYAYPPQQPQPYDPAVAYGAPAPAYPQAAPELKNNGLAIASLVVSIASILTCGLAGILGAILGHVGRKQVRERGDAGDGLALAGIIVGYVLFAMGLLFVAFLAFVYDAASDYEPAYNPTPYPTY